MDGSVVASRWEEFSLLGFSDCVEPLEGCEIDYELGVGEFACNYHIGFLFPLRNDLVASFSGNGWAKSRLAGISPFSINFCFGRNFLSKVEKRCPLVKSVGVSIL